MERPWKSVRNDDGSLHGIQGGRWPRGALFGILLLGSAVPALFYAAGSLLIYFYPLTAHRHAEIRAAFERAGVPAGVDPIPEMVDP